MRLAFDIETNGLLPKLTKVHCIGITDVDTKETYDCRPDELGDALVLLENAEELIGHNILDFDIPAIQKVYPKFQPKGRLTDTLIISRLIYPHLKQVDFQRKMKLGRLMGSHGLEAWGHRLKCHKGDYAREMKERGLDPWAEFNEWMFAYCQNDVVLTVKLYEMFMRHGFSQRSIEIEHAVHRYCTATTAHGVSFDEAAGYELYNRLCREREKAEAYLREVFQPWEESEWFTPKRNNKTRGYVAGVPFEKKKLVEFNPGSRHHIAKRLTALHGWKPKKFSPNGQPVVDEKVLKQLPYPEVKPLMRYLMIQKRIGQLAEGKAAWLKLVKEGRIHGRINTNAAITGRASHDRPNTAQVPAVKSEFGADCRALFRATPGAALVGADASGLELRCFAHYLSHYDDGAYTDLVLNGDIHTANQKAAGLPTRDDAKTFIYALLYGAGNFKIGQIIGKGAKEGAALRKRFMRKLPAYRELVEGVTKASRKRGKIKGLDGRYIHIRSEHAALNSLLQGAGAVIMKQAMINYHRDLEERGIPFKQVLWVHDEFQVECAPEHADTVGQAMVDAIEKCTEQFSFGCPLTGEYKVGTNWSHTH